jgi:murein DD-endopeptidase MepM/ murein hydrolase activator NlpD
MGFTAALPLRASDQAFSIQSSSISVGVSTATAEVEPFVWPVSKTIAGKKTKIVSGFGKRTPLAPNPPVAEMHEGVDFAVPPGSTVHAARSGKVLFVGFSKAYVSRDDKTDQQHLIIIRHADGMSTRYVHLNTLRVRPMQDVKSGEVLGTTSESDEWTEPVLHFEIREANGHPVDPQKLLIAP